jgi:hypothetical protein
MFICILCPSRFTVDDIKAGQYFPSTGICLPCYKSMAANPVLCFGDKIKYDTRTIACQQCPDERICKTFIKRRNHE